jgi:hypothetical protein
MQYHANRTRSVTKAVTYRAGIVCLDFLVIYLLTGEVRTAAAFMIVSNIYTPLPTSFMSVCGPTSSGAWSLFHSMTPVFE